MTEQSRSSRTGAPVNADNAGADRGVVRASRRHGHRAVAAMLAVLVVVAGCSLLGEKMSKEERVSAFMSDLDANAWGDLYLHIHPDNPNRNTLKSPETWNPSPYADNGNYSWSNYTEDGTTVTIDVSSDNDGAHDGETYTFTMKEDTPGLWYINKLESTNGSVSPIISDQ